MRVWILRSLLSLVLHLLLCRNGTSEQREVNLQGESSSSSSNDDEASYALLATKLQANDPALDDQDAIDLAAIVHAGGAERATIVASVSGLTALVNALAAHPDSVGVQREACRALASILPFGETANLPTLCRSQTEPLLQAAASQFPVECAPLVEQILPHL